MSDSIISSARVPSDLYIEREADKQLRRIIKDMARPGYVLVARQMGKTNLLLHAKELLENDRNIFVYVDFSTMTDYSERECLNYLIDTAIEISYSRMQDAEEEISTLRALKTYNATRMFSRELRILLKYVDKIVFVLDEIDALARREYSDRVFSMIRGHYYANTNFPELKKATFILSGVIEPKDIIKDPNISPFNIGEKIYLNDFTREEFFALVDKIEYLRDQGEDVRERLYHWAKGQPRISWDLCAAAEHNKVKTAAEVDSLVKRMYLTQFDRPPIDSIRDLIKSDGVMKDALIQLSINKGEALDDKVVSRLYLAGIINYNQTVPDFKNPIMAASLSYDWLISIHGRNIDYISEAEKSINLEKDYSKAINLLTAFLTDSKDLSRESYNRAHFLLAKAYFRNFDGEKALKELNVLDNFDKSYKYYYEERLLRGSVFVSINNNDLAEVEFRNIINEVGEEDEATELKASIYLSAVLIESGETEKLNEAETILIRLQTQKNAALVRNRLHASLFFLLASIEERKGNSKRCVNHIDSALLTAQPNEKQRLLHFKLHHTDDKESCAVQLYNSLEEIKGRPDAEYFGNLLILNTLYACIILAELMISYPQYDVTRYLRLFLYDSKESAVLFIYKILSESEIESAEPFFHLMGTLLNDEEWQFQQSELIDLAFIRMNKYNDFSICDRILDKCRTDTVSLPENIQRLISARIRYALIYNENHIAEKYINLYKEISSRIVGREPMDVLMTNYIESVILFRNEKIIEFEKVALSLLNDIERFRALFSEKADNDQEVRLAMCRQIKESTEETLKQINTTRRNWGLLPTYDDLERNSVIGVIYGHDGSYIEGKFKKLQEDLELGKCKLEKVIKK